MRFTDDKLVAVQKNAVLLERPVPLRKRMFTPPGWGESLLRSYVAEGIRAEPHGLTEDDCPAGLHLVCRWVGTPSAAVAGSLGCRAPTGNLVVVQRPDVRPGVGALAHFGALRLDGPPDARVMALTLLGRAALPSC